MRSKQAQVRVGLFTIAAAILVVIVIVTFTTIHLFRHRARYEVVFAGSVYGLEKGSLVYFDGIKRGSVDAIEVEPTDLAKVRVTIQIDPDTPVRTDTTAELTMAGITGLKVVDLRGGSPTAPQLADGATLVAKPGMLDRIQTVAEHLTTQTDELMTKVGKLVDRTSHVADNLDQASAALRDVIADNKDAFHHTLASIDATVANVGATLDKLGDNANQAIARVRTFVDGANGVVGDVGRIVHANENQLTGAIADLRQASRTFKDLARELRDKPSRVLFSSGAADRKLP